MKLYLEGHNFDYASQQIYMCLFPNSHAEIVEERPKNGDFSVIKLSFSENRVLSRTEIYLDGKESFSECEFSFSPIDEEDRKRACRRGIKTSFYNAALPFLPKTPAWGALTGIRPSKVAANFLREGMDEKLSAEMMEKEYFVSKERAELAVSCAVRAEKLLKSAKKRDMSLYVGIPFCVSRCRYCSFVSHSIEKARHLVSPYLHMLEREIKMLGDSAKEAGLLLKSIYIGGGTPTSLENDELAFVMKCISDNFDIKNVGEYTVEGGRPDTLTMDKIRTIREGGATRISVNPQTMNDEILKAMDRRHTAQDVVQAIGAARAVGGLVINTDLIAGLPGDSFDSFQNSVDRMTELSPENITVHTLAIKKGSELHREKYILPDGKATEEMVEYAMHALYGSGYVPYYLYRQKYMSGNLENVGYSKPGYESDYNNYIMDELHTILSAGAGGVTKLIDRENGRIERIFNPKYPYEYNNATEKIAETQKSVVDFFAEWEA
ncbi:MAG: coproporphyrinogen dehydrogenase HemZ [Oscillospiraceae bacterium]|nr:coproporphyrinogen dehydrogenase HemZ [Oscillospiraceae bacterium]